MPRKAKVSGYETSNPYEIRASLYRESLYRYVRDAWEHVESVPFVDSYHIGAIAEHLQAVSTGQIMKLLINIPPGCSKSLMTCVFWPTWEWAITPSLRWFFASYDQRLSTRDSVRSRTLMQSKWYINHFPGQVVLTGDQNQKVYYENDKGGYRMSTSVGGHGTGEHPDRIVVDDPHNVKEAESELERKNTLEWWDLTMATRGVARNARRVIIMQRLHEEDLSGHVMEKEHGWTHICLPMRYEPNRMLTTCLGWNDPRRIEGELLTKNQFDETKLQEMERSLGAYGTAGQMQQRPVPKGGGLFKDWFFNSRKLAAPYHAKRVRYWDTAGTLDGNATVGTLMAKDADGDYYIEHVEWGKWEPGERDKVMIAVAKRDRVRYGPSNEPIIWIEKGMADAGITAFKHIVKKLSGFRVFGHKPTGNKEERALPFASQCAALNVHLVDDKSWDINGWIKELCAFPAGKEDDRVDSASGAFGRLEATKVATGIRVYAHRGTKKGKLEVLPCSADELKMMVVEDPSLLISISATADQTPQHGLARMLDFFILPIHDIAPEEHQETWDQVVEGYGRLPADLAMTKDQGRAFWAFITKKRPVNPSVILIQDDGGADRRAMSVACAVADVLIGGRNLVYSPTRVDNIGGEKEPPNKHIYAVVKGSRNLVAV